MWLSLSNAFLSIVEPSPADQKTRPGCLLVRARREGDIERIFGEASGAVERRPERDYLFRAFILREVVATIVADNVMSIDYGNFKNSVKNHDLHDAYAGVWSIMARLQPSRPYSGANYGYLAPAKRVSRQKEIAI
jgi:hypothetical protein